MTATPSARQTMARLSAWLSSSSEGEALKRRDLREPGRERKEAHERKLDRVMWRWLSAQRAAVVQALRINSWRLKDDKASVIIDALDSTEFNAQEGDIARVVLSATMDGVRLFDEFNTLRLDYTLTNAEAAAWAREHAGELVKGANVTTKAVIRRAVAAFVSTPGMTMGDVMDMLPFNRVRSQMIATTEVTNAYASAEQIAGRQLKVEYPDVMVVKRWYTNADDRVCPICRPLNGAIVEVDESFPGGLMHPAAHVSCRCWMSTTTRMKT